MPHHATNVSEVDTHTHTHKNTHVHTQTHTYIQTSHRNNFKVVVKWVLAPHKMEPYNK